MGQGPTTKLEIKSISHNSATIARLSAIPAITLACNLTARIEIASWQRWYVESIKMDPYLNTLMISVNGRIYTKSEISIKHLDNIHSHYSSHEINKLAISL